MVARCGLCNETVSYWDASQGKLVSFQSGMGIKVTRETNPSGAEIRTYSRCECQDKVEA